MLRFLFNALLGLVLLGIVSTALVAWYIVPRLPDIDSLRNVELQVPLRVYSDTGSLIAEFGEMRRTPVNIDEVPETFIQAFLAAEDDRFYEHPGVDWQGILRAAIQLARTGEKKQGGSTITMQVARNFFLTRDKTYLRKINEIFLALKIERELSKQQILELYLNKIYLGQRAYGIGAAAQVYYGSSPDELTLAQMATIAGLPKAPSTTNPVTNLERARERRTYVLNRMRAQGYINSQQYEQAVNTPPVAVKIHATQAEVEAPYVAEMVRQYMVDHYGEEAAYTSGYRVYTTIRDELQQAANQSLRDTLLDYDKRHGYRGPEDYYELDAEAGETQWQQLLDNYSSVGGLKPALITAVAERSATAYVRNMGAVDIAWEGLNWARPYKTVNWQGNKPDEVGDVVSVGDVVRVLAVDKPLEKDTQTDTNGEQVNSNKTPKTERSWRLTQLPAVNGALVSVDPHNGATLALVGGFDFARSKFNRVTQARRQPGSSFKPFIYSAALEQGYTTASIINDAPVVFPDSSLEDVWRPKNYSGKTHGPTRMREALIHSRNLVSIRLLHAVGVPFVMNHLKRFGFDTERLPSNLSLALGSGTVSPYELVRGYSVFANGGFLIQPHFIQRIEDSMDDEIIHEAELLVACNECGPHDSQDAPLSDAVAELMADAGLLPAPIDLDDYAPRTLDAENAWLVSSMTQDVVQRGTGARAYRELGRGDLSGKTGTTNDQRDSWFAGFNHEIATVVWLGFDEFQPLGNRETGASAALPMWIDYMRVALEDKPESTLPRPDGLVNARIDPETGKLARSDNKNAIFEVFRPGNVPTEYARQAQDETNGGKPYSEQLF